MLDSVTVNLYVSLAAFQPELALVATIVLLLLVRLFQRRPTALWGVALCGSLVALMLAGWQLMVDAPQAGDAREIFSGLLVYDSFTAYFRTFLLLFAALVIWLTSITGIPDREDSPDFYTLLLGATLGMSLMASANHLLMVFIAVEMASVPSYAMAGFLKGRRQASEAALKYVVYGGGAAGVMLYGISLLTGLCGTAHLPSVGEQLYTLIAQRVDPETGRVVFDAQLGTVVLAILLLLVGVSFKIAAVPFHFWCPDVFEGAATEVAAFLSVASKAAALALLVRIALALGVPPGLTEAPAQGVPLREWLATALAVLGAMTATFGNLAAYAQTNLKRLLAYSTIAHAGYMVMPVAAMLVMLGRGGTGEPAQVHAVQSLLFYLAAYLFMNLGAFAVVAFIRNEIRSEDLGDYEGLWRMCPGLTVCMGIFLFSLTGIPFLAGYFAKFYIFAALFEAGQYNSGMYWLVVILGINTVISLFYYLKILGVMVFKPSTTEWESVRLPMTSAAGLYTGLVALPVLLLGVWWAAYGLAGNVAESLAALSAR